MGIVALSAQENYVSGYMINKNKDTIKGYIDYKNWKFPPKKIYFKKTLAENSRLFNPNNIQEFGVAEDIYVSAVVESENSLSKTNRLTKEREPNITLDTTFLQALVQGEKSLYFYKNEIGKENYYLKNDDKFELLVQKKYTTNQGDKRVIAENKKYRSQLRLYLYDCPSIQQKIRKTTYTYSSLMKLFDAFYECSNIAPNYAVYKEKVLTKFGLVAGITSTSLNFTGDEGFAYLTEPKFNSSINPTFGVSIEFILPRNLKKWSLYNELLFTSFNYEATYNDFESENRNATHTTELGYSYLKINTLFRYALSTGAVATYFNTGFSNGLVFSEIANYTKEDSVFYAFETSNEGKALTEIKSYEIGFIVGLGANYKNFSLEFRFDRGNGLSRFLYLNSSTKKYSLLLGYQF